jgi:hypothetical protein
MSDTLTPEALLAAARDLCQRTDIGTAGLWPRVAVLLARQAIEESLSLYWQAANMEALSASPTRTQLICLVEVAGTDLAGTVSSSWARLSGACHVHPYDLAPTAPELLNWIDAVTNFCGTPGDPVVMKS